MNAFLSRLFLALCLVIGAGTANGDLSAQDAASADSESEVDAGHSYHGEVFNEGARQAAKLLDGLPKINFPTAAKNTDAQAFVEQGIAQLHGFWYLEAERSFRQAAAIEPELAIAYWGCACANINNLKRAKGFIEEAKKRLGAPTTPREKMYIESLARYLNAVDSKSDDAKQKSHQGYISDLEKIIDEYPDDVEAKAFLVLQLWLADNDGLKMPSRYAVSALLDNVFAVQPMHPAHHYRIHLWDNTRPQNAIDSAAKSGPSMPGVAHMWHMPGHTYSKLHRYADAVWQQEASARVDHEFMIDARIMPDQIHNFAHNNEWMIRNLIHLGRVQDAIEHAKHLISLPQHPKYNTYEKGSARFGRERLLQSLTSFSLWKQLIQEAGGSYLGDTDSDSLNQDRDTWLAVAHVMEGNKQQARDLWIELRREKVKWESKLLDDTQKKSNGSDEKDLDKLIKESKDHVKRLQELIARVSSAFAAIRGDEDAVERFAKTAKLDAVLQAQWLALAKDLEGAQKLAEKAMKDGKGQVRPVAVLVDILWKRDKTKEAIKRFTELRRLAHDADLDLPLFQSIAPVAAEAKIEGDWRIARKLPGDVGERPEWEALGPEFWHPYPSPSIDAERSDGTKFSSSEFAGKPRLVFFYLGFGCLHCVEQLKLFSPKVDEFRALGIEMVAVSTEDMETLQNGIKNFDETIPFPLLSDPENASFKSFRCWDDFESIAMHGTFLIDGNGRVRWQDIGPEPFNDPDFLITESKRLLALPE